MWGDAAVQQQQQQHDNTGEQNKTQPGPAGDDLAHMEPLVQQIDEPIAGGHHNDRKVNDNQEYRRVEEAHHRVE